MTRLPRCLAPTACAFLLALGMTTTHAASFDCAKASTATEKAICADPALSTLDSDLAAAFKNALTLWPAGNWSTFIRREQRDWIKVRDSNCKADRACLKNEYESRLTLLKRPGLKYLGRYVAGACPKNGIYVDATPTFPADGVGVDIYVCPSPKGNMLLQASGRVDAAGELKFDDAGCPRTLRFTQDAVSITGGEAGRCKLTFTERSFRRDAAKSPYEAE